MNHFWKMEPEAVKATKVGDVLSSYSDFHTMFKVLKVHPRKRGVTVREVVAP